MLVWHSSYWDGKLILNHRLQKQSHTISLISASVEILPRVGCEGKWLAGWGQAGARPCLHKMAVHAPLKPNKGSQFEITRSLGHLSPEIFSVSQDHPLPTTRPFYGLDFLHQPNGKGAWCHNVWFVEVCRQGDRVAASPVLPPSQSVIKMMECLGEAKLLFQSFIPLSLSRLNDLCRSVSLLARVGLSSVFHHFYRFGSWWHSPERWLGPNWKFWLRKLQRTGSFGNFVISQIVKNVNRKVCGHLSICWREIKQGLARNCNHLPGPPLATIPFDTSGLVRSQSSCRNHSKSI